MSEVVIRRTWSGFGECRIIIAPRSAAPRRRFSSRLCAGPSRLLSEIGLASLRFTIDPKLLEGAEEPNGAMVPRFLQAHGEALTKEWRARQEAAEKRDADRPRRSPEAARLIAVTAQDLSRRRLLLLVATLMGLLIFGAAARIAYKYSADPLNARISFDNGQRELAQNQYAQAIQSFNRAIRLEPAFADAYLYRGRALIAKGDRASAIQDFSDAIQLQPSNPRLYLERGGTYFDMGNFPAASADATHALELDPLMAKAFNLRGIATREMGEPRKALMDLDRAVELDPGQANYFQRASTNQALGDHRKAIEDLTRLLETEPGDVSAYYARARSKRAIGDNAGAALDSQHAKDLEHR